MSATRRRILDSTSDRSNTPARIRDKEGADQDGGQSLARYIVGRARGIVGDRQANRDIRSVEVFGKHDGGIASQASRQTRLLCARPRNFAVGIAADARGPQSARPGVRLVHQASKCSILRKRRRCWGSWGHSGSLDQHERSHFRCGPSTGYFVPQLTGRAEKGAPRRQAD
jgi:hypothetical protein